MPLGSIQTVKINFARCILSPFLTFLVVLGKKQDLGCQTLGAGHPLEGATDISTLGTCPGHFPLHRRTPKKNPKKLPLIRGGFFSGSGTVRPTGLAPVAIERGDQIESTMQISTPCDTWKDILTTAKVSKFDSVLREGWKKNQGGRIDCCNFRGVDTTLWPISPPNFKLLAQF